MDQKSFNSKNLIVFLVFMTTLLLIQCGKELIQESDPLYLNPDLSLNERVDDLVARMTLEEKVSQMVHSASAVERLGIPEYNWWNECLHGVARAGIATVFPQAIGLAATWDEEHLYNVATVISDEARAKHHEFVRQDKRGIYQGLTFWSPNINIFRDPRWGRGMETYGEDPYLTGRMGIAFVKGLQGNDPNYLKVVATPKHYAVHSGPEPDRHTFDARTGNRDLYETYLPHFQACIEVAGAFSVMCAYNRFSGEACCGSSLLLSRILRNDWGFEGYVVSDCGAIRDIFKGHQIVQTSPEAAALGVKSGCDLNCGSQYRSLYEAVEKGYITEKEIDISVKRLFRARFKLGMFDPPERVPFKKIPYSVVNCEEHKELALRTAQKSIVLLKNENNILPLKKDIRSIAVIGPNADDYEVLLGNYNGNPSDPVTPLKGIREKASSDTEVHYALGCPLAGNLPYLEVVPSSALSIEINGEIYEGLLGEYFDNRDFKGNPLLIRVDNNIDFNWWDKAPDRRLDDDDFSVRWTGTLLPPETGVYAIGGEGFNGFRIYLDGKLIVDFNGRHHPRKTYKKIKLFDSRPYQLKVEYFERSEDAHMKLLWSVPGIDYEKDALEKAGKSDVVIMVMGLSPRLEGEEMDVDIKGFKGGDRLSLDLPDIQNELLKKIQALGKPMVLILLNGSAVSINWAQENIPAIIEAWYPGQAAGQAIADVLFGDYNPAGRLPVTFYRSVEQLPPFEEYAMKGRTYRYFTGEPLYPFGFGLSYTKFEYSELKAPTFVLEGERIPVSITVSNTGDRTGEEVVQLYVTDVMSSLPSPIRSLRRFKRVRLEPGEKVNLKFILEIEDISLFDDRGIRVCEPGLFEISVGGKQPHFKGYLDARTTGVLSAKVEVLEDQIPKGR